MQCISSHRWVFRVFHAQVEHERVQGRLFDLHESRDIASNAAAAASDLTSQQKEALAQQVRSVDHSAAQRKILVMLRGQHTIQCCRAHRLAAQSHFLLCRTLQLERDRLEERLSDLKAESLLQRGTPVLDAAACLPVDTALHRALRNDKESLKWELEVFIALPHYPFHGSSQYIQLSSPSALWASLLIYGERRQCCPAGRGNASPIALIHTFKAQQQAASAKAPATAAEHTARRGEWWPAGGQLENLRASSDLQECKAQHAAAQAEAAAAQAAAQQQSEALRRELAGRPSQAEVAALRERVEALRLLVDSREEDGGPEQADGAAPISTVCITTQPGRTSWLHAWQIERCKYWGEHMHGAHEAQVSAT